MNNGKVIGGGAYVPEDIRKELFNYKFLEKRCNEQKKEGVVCGILFAIILIPTCFIITRDTFLTMGAIAFSVFMFLTLYYALPYTSTVGLNEEFDNRKKEKKQ